MLTVPVALAPVVPLTLVSARSVLLLERSAVWADRWWQAAAWLVRVWALGHSGILLA